MISHFMLDSVAGCKCPWMKQTSIPSPPLSNVYFWQKNTAKSFNFLRNSLVRTSRCSSKTGGIFLKKNLGDDSAIICTI